MSGQARQGRPLEIIQLAQDRRAGLALFLQDLKNCGDEPFFAPHAGDEDAIRDMIAASRRDLYYLMVEGDEVLAYGLLRGWDEGFVIPSLGIAVHPGAKRRGLARLLMDFLHSVAARSGSDKVRLRVHTGNTNAIALYMGLGYDLAPDANSPDYLVGFKTLKPKNDA